MVLQAQLLALSRGLIVFLVIHYKDTHKKSISRTASENGKNDEINMFKALRGIYGKVF